MYLLFVAATDPLTLSRIWDHIYSIFSDKIPNCCVFLCGISVLLIAVVVCCWLGCAFREALAV
jgi:hypothetical protein